MLAKFVALSVALTHVARLLQGGETRVIVNLAIHFHRHAERPRDRR